MTEAQWLGEIDPSMLISHLQIKDKVHRTKAGRRRLRLFGCACCRRAWPLFAASEARKDLVEAAEQLAQGVVSAESLVPLLARVPVEGEYGLGPCLNAAARYAASPDIIRASARVAIVSADAVAYSRQPPSTDEHVQIVMAERRQQLTVLRCIFGNPFRPVTLNSSWQTTSVVGVAQGIIADHAFDRLPILADALQDAGCEDEAILAHCRGPGPHFRGCWVVDLVLGKQ